jgi:hypothetical protein
MQESPLTAFFALKVAVTRKSTYADVAASAIEAWLSLDETKSAAFFSRRMRALHVLTEVESPVVLQLTHQFPITDQRQPLFEARFRNGDIGAGLRWLTEYSFEMSIAGHQELVRYMHTRLGSRLVAEVSDVLQTRDSPLTTVRGALYLAGYLGESALAPAVRAAWNTSNPQQRDLEAFLWAAAQVCGDEAALTLGPVCDAWAALPERDDNAPREPSRTTLAAHGLSWKFRDHPPRAALPYFVERAKSDALSWPITFMLRGVDDPIAVQHEVEYLAERSRQSEGQGGFVDHFVKDEWRRQSEDFGRPMSTASKERLFNLSANQKNDTHLRKQALALWEISVAPNDVEIARSIPSGDVRHDTAIWARVRRQDLSVIPELVEKIQQKPWYWWQAGRYIWSEELTALLDESIRIFAQSPLDQHEDLGQWSFSENLLRIEVLAAERILIKHWGKLRFHPKFIQVAIFFLQTS